MDNIIHVVATEKKIPQDILNDMQNSLIYRKLLNIDFLNALTNKVFDFNNIEPQDIIDIVHGNSVNSNFIRVSTIDISKKMGIKLEKIPEDGKNEGSIETHKEHLLIKYCGSSPTYQRRFIRGHEIGHLVLHLMNNIKLTDDIKFKVIDRKYKNKLPLDVSSSTIEEAKVLAYLKVDNTLYPPEAMKYEKEATLFAHKLLLCKYNFDKLLNSGTTLSAKIIIDYFRIPVSTLTTIMDINNVKFDMPIENYKDTIIRNDLSLVDLAR